MLIECYHIPFGMSREIALFRKKHTNQYVNYPKIKENILQTLTLKNTLHFQELDIEEVLTYIHLFQELNTNISLNKLDDRLNNMNKENYIFVKVYDRVKCHGVFSYKTTTKLYSGKQLELENLILYKNSRNMGIGKIVINYIIEKALILQCTSVELNVYIDNTNAIKFYEKYKFKKIGHHLIKCLV